MTVANFHGVGRRKSSVARVWLKPGKGNVEVNGKDYTEYFPTLLSREAVKTALKVVEQDSAYDIKVNVQGGGFTGQAEAAKLGVARAILSTNESFRILLRQAGLLTVDARIKERKKPGQKGARKKFQFVKR